MIGCPHETGKLNYDEVFEQFSQVGSNGGTNSGIRTGKVVFGRSPCEHTGDVRVLSAVDNKGLHHMVDCVVFPQKGCRPHPDECFGGDLDGDMFFVFWDKDLILPMPYEAMDYTTSSLDEVNHDIQTEDLVQYFTNNISNTTVGAISNYHMAFADKEPVKARSGKCLELAKLFSKLVNSFKTGECIEIPYNLRPQNFPDFLAKPHEDLHISETVIGYLYHNPKFHGQETVNPFTSDMAQEKYDADMEVDGFWSYIAEAIRVKEITLDFKDTQVVGLGMESLRNEARNWFNDSTGEMKVEAKASAWYHVTYHQKFWK